MRAITFVSTLLIAGATACKTPSTKPAPPPPPSPAPPAAKSEPAPKPDPAPVAYDKAMIKSIQVRWLQLLDERGYGGGVKGRMIVEFNLHSDGSVSNINVVENNLPASFAPLCDAAIKAVSPFATWPEAMRREIGKDQRTVRFTFSF